jgi:hypothetical protein
MEGTVERKASPWLTIWTTPRATLRRILETDPEHMVVFLVVLGGFVQALERASKKNLGDSLPVLAIIALCAILGPIYGALKLYINAPLLLWTGSWIRGQAALEDIRAAIAWASVPTICMLPLWVLELGFLGNELFTSKGIDAVTDPLLLVPLLALMVIHGTVYFWGWIIFLKCLAEAQRFSAWRALGNIALAGAIVIAPFALLLLALMPKSL